MYMGQDEPLKELLEQIYQSKCLELNIENQDILRNRFISTVYTEIPKGTLNLSNQSLRAPTMPYVVELIRHLGTSVSALNLDLNPIGDDGCGILLDAFDHLKNYTSISLNSVGLNPEGLMVFLGAFQNEDDPARLEALNIGSNPSAERRNRFNEDSSRFLGQFISRCSTLRTINLANTQLRQSNGYLIFKNINRETNVQTIMLQNTGISNQAIHQLCSVNARFFPYIKTLDISGNATITYEACEDIANFIQRQRHFHNLNLQNCSELHNGLIKIFESLQYKSAEKVAEDDEKRKRDAIRTKERTNHLLSLGPGVVNLLTYDRVILKSDQMKKLEPQQEEQKAEDKTTALHVLDLSNVKLSEKQLQQLAESMEYNQSLEVLNLENCGIDFNKTEYLEPFKLFCENIQKSVSLKVISLARNVLGDKVNDCMYKLLKIPTLEVLNLSFCRLHDGCFVNMAKQLVHCQRLKKMLVQGNNCDNDGATALLAALQEYTRLHVLDLNLNKISFQLQEKLAGVIKQNIDQSCTDVYTQLQAEHNKLSEQVSLLQETEFKLQESYARQQQLYKEIQQKAADLLQLNEEFEARLQEERRKYDDLVKQQTRVDGELQQITQNNQDLQQRIESEQATFDGKRRQIREKQKAAQARIDELDEQIAQMRADPDLAQTTKELERKKREKESAEKEAVVVLAQLAAIEAVLIKEGFLTVAPPPNAKKAAVSKKK